MKLIIQIPCLNETGTLAIALGALPRTVPGFDSVEWLIIDDGSTDGTADLARQLGADHVVRHTVNRGLAAAFMTGLNACLRLGADVIVNTDADNQYEAADAPSGFRAISRETALRLNVFNAYTYTLETIIQAGLSNLRVISVPIRTNPDLRPSRLVRSISSYVRRSLVTILRVFVTYRPLRDSRRADRRALPVFLRHGQW